MTARLLAAIQPLDQPRMVPSGNQIDRDASSDERRSKPERQPVRPHWGSVLDQLQLLQEEPKPRDHKAESH